MEYNFDEEIAFLTDITLAKGVSGREKAWALKWPEGGQRRWAFW